MTWDITTPAGTESKSQGDDRIRELKTDIQTALRGDAASGDEAVFPGSDTASPVARYRGLKNTTVNRPAPGDYGLFTDTTRNVLQRDNGATWEDIATLIPAGTVMVFYQAAAPVGWTQVVTQNDKALRVVSAAGGGSGGTYAVSAGASHSHTTPDHAHQLDDTGPTGSPNTPLTTDPVYTTDGGNSPLLIIFSGGGGSTIYPLKSGTKSGGSGTSGTSSPVVAYIDVLLASKD